MLFRSLHCLQRQFLNRYIQIKTEFEEIDLIHFLLPFYLFAVFSCFAGDLQTKELRDFLDGIASAEKDKWEEVVEREKKEYPLRDSSSSLAQFLSSLKEKIQQSDDLELIRLFQRAVRNHDTLSAEKAEPVANYYKHYLPPDFLITDIHLTLDINEKDVLVTTELQIERSSQKDHLILDGRGHHVFSLFIDGEEVSKDLYQVTAHELILRQISDKDHFQLTINSQINPFQNNTLEGMYPCGKWLTTQCESEGARRIFFTIDRPDVLSRIKTTIIADPNLYPYRLSNGNFAGEEVLENGRTLITWDDPIPKPSYLFACVLGDFSRILGQFITRSGKKVELQIYVEPGKESRASYALYALKKAMDFDEVFFDREYDLDYLKLVAIPDFNSGAMENKGLMIFNEMRLLVDASSGSDQSFRDVAHVIAHEYFHNWTGNRVTVRNWFEISLKEGFTDFRAMLFSEWLFGQEFIRPKDVQLLQENQFPEETSEKGHSIIVDSYVDAHSIYDSTTYIKGREVFRTLKNLIDFLIPDGFKEVQNAYFDRYDGQAVTFKELLKAANTILSRVGKDLSAFERWFYQPGTPVVDVKMAYDETKKAGFLTVAQSCPHPRTGDKQKPFQIPFSAELLGNKGTVLLPKFHQILEEEETIIPFAAEEKPIPLFFHGYSAPVILAYEYSLEDLSCIIKFSDDPYCRWEAGRKYFILALQKMIARIEENPKLLQDCSQKCSSFADLFTVYQEVLQCTNHSLLTKAQLLELPSLRALSQAFDDYDFEKLEHFRTIFIKQLALYCQLPLQQILIDHRAPKHYEPQTDQMQVRELRHKVLRLLSINNDQVNETIDEQYQTASNFDDLVTAFHLCLQLSPGYKERAVHDFYQRWKEDKAIFNYWLTSQASSSSCSVADLKRLEQIEGYDGKNPNHIRSLFRTYIVNLACFHARDGEGYEYIVDKILEIAPLNPTLAHNHLVVPAFVDFEKLPFHLQTLMVKALLRLRLGDIPTQTRDLLDKLLNHYNSVAS